jgi:cell division protein FtsL
MQEKNQFTGLEKVLYVNPIAWLTFVMVQTKYISIYIPNAVHTP